MRLSRSLFVLTLLLVTAPAVGQSVQTGRVIGATMDSGDGTVRLRASVGGLTASRLSDGDAVITPVFWPVQAPAGPPAPTAPRLLAPADDAAGVDLAPTLSWLALAHAVHYTVQIARDAGFADLVAELHPATTAVTAPELAPSTRYVWRVRAVWADGAGAFSEPFAFTTRTAVTLEADARPTAYHLEGNHPNPFRSATTLLFSLPEPGPVRLVVYDALGRAVRTLVDGVRPAGRHRIRFEAGALPSGLYIYQLDAGAFRQTRTMLLTR